MEQDVPVFEIVCDGSQLPRSNAGGWAAMVRKLHRAGEVPRLTSAGGSAGCSTEAEIQAMLLGLRSVPEGARARLLSDRQDLIGLLREGRQVQGRLQGLMNDVLNECRRRTVVPVWVRGHRGHPAHTACDRAARAAAIRAMHRLGRRSTAV